MLIASICHLYEINRISFKMPLNEKCTIYWGFSKSDHKIVRFALQCKRYKLSNITWFF